MYSLVIHPYALVVALIPPFHKRTRLMRFGQWRTNSILCEKIDRNAKYIWFHASSLSEFEQGRPMIENIRAERPEYEVSLTFFSPSGYEVRKNYEGADVICYLPSDTSFRVKKFLNLASPAIATFIKYEFWGNYLRELRKRGIPVYIISAIFRPDQLFFQWFRKPYRKMLSYSNHLFIQDERSMKLLNEFGITNVMVTGDTRFNRVLDVCKQARELPFIERFLESEGGKRPIVMVAGSSWPQGEATFIPYSHEHPEMKLIIVPHEVHREHLLSIEAMLKHPSVRLSEAYEDDLVDKNYLITDSFGLLSSIYRYGRVAYIGSGFGTGIHNTLEAAVYGMPALFGPRYHKFKEAKDLIVVGGGFSITGDSSFRTKMDKLLTDPTALETSGQAAGDFVKNSVEATDQILR